MKHGTYGRYQQHTGAGEPPCAACKKAAAQYKREWRKRGNAAVAHETWLTSTRAMALERMTKDYPIIWQSTLKRVRQENPEDPPAVSA